MDKEDPKILSTKNAVNIRCPSCALILKSSGMQRHCDFELSKLVKMRVKSYGELKETCVDLAKESNLQSSSWQIFQTVKVNRKSRLKLQSQKRYSADYVCPRNVSCGSSDYEPGNACESFEEYEWAGQKRIRVSSLLQGGYALLGLGTTVTHCKNENDEEDLNVVEDDTKIYGPVQYAECDIISPVKDKDALNDINSTTYMRNVFAKRPVKVLMNNFNLQKYQKCFAQEKIVAEAMIENLAEEYLHKNKNPFQIIESLKAKLKTSESQVQNKLKCLICLDDFKKPAISVSCWHVHCEECWLRSLGSRKLCPQCNLITSPADLRRIYM